MIKIGVLACSNGLGHVRRVVSICAFLLRHGFEGSIDAFMPKSHLERMSNWLECRYFINHPNVTIIDFYHPKNIARNTPLVEKAWEGISLPNLDKYDIFWSDNILDVLKKRPDSIITGSFFWYEVFANSKVFTQMRNFVDSQRFLIEKYDPIIVGNEFFATPGVKAAPRFIPIGFYRYETIFKEKTTSNILYASGLGGEEEVLFENGLNKIINQNLRPPGKMFVEPSLLPSVYPDWVQIADFSAEMFQSCMASCIRPGLGTISDSIVSQNKIFAYSSHTSFEMENNSRVIEKMNLGEKCQSPFDAYTKAISYVSDREKVKEYILRTSNIRTDGVYATANIILNHRALV